MRKRGWSNEDLQIATKNSSSIRQVLFKLHLKEAGGNYKQIKKYLTEYGIDSFHFTGKASNKGRKSHFLPKIPLEKLLVENNNFQSFKLKKRLFAAGLKKEQCELCGWAIKSKDGRIPVELDHINGINSDNRLENLRILCPNCHSLMPTHRGRNRKKQAGVVEW